MLKVRRLACPQRSPTCPYHSLAWGASIPGRASVLKGDKETEINRHQRCKETDLKRHHFLLSTAFRGPPHSAQSLSCVPEMAPKDSSLKLSSPSSDGPLQQSFSRVYEPLCATPSRNLAHGQSFLARGLLPCTEAGHSCSYFLPRRSSAFLLFDSSFALTSAHPDGPGAKAAPAAAHHH
jgi:hypothetical protein